jgi:hypothetical protein
MKTYLHGSLFRRVIAILLLSAAIGAHAQTTNTVAFQGRVASSGGTPVADGVYRMSFTILSAPTLGDTLWTETDFNVPVAGGLFTHALGSSTPFPEGLFGDAADLYIEIAIDVNNNGLDAGDIQSPRTPLNAVPVALNAKDAAMLGGVAAQDFPTNASVTADIALLESTINIALADAASAVVDSQAAQDAVISGKADTADLGGKLDKTGPAYIVTTVTSDAATNAANLQQAYAQAKLLTPHGLPLSDTNRAAVLVPPGRYNLGTAQFVLDTDYVDVIGLSSEARNQYIFGTASGSGTGVLAHTATISTIANLRVHCTRTSGGLSDTAPAAYYPVSEASGHRVVNCIFEANGTNALAMRGAVTFAGYYQDVRATDYAFGTFGGSATGEFIRCTAGRESFGTNGLAIGLFVECNAGAFSFGGGTSGITLGGRFYRCILDTPNPWGTTSFSGVMEGCDWKFTGGMRLAATARLYNSTIRSTVDANGTAAGVAYCRINTSFTNTGSMSFNQSNIVSAASF